MLTQLMPSKIGLLIHVNAKSLSSLFENAARELTGIIAETTGTMRDVTSEIEIDASTHEHLMQAWLEEIIRLLNDEHLLFVNFSAEGVQKNNGEVRLYAYLLGEELSRERYNSVCLYRDLKVNKVRIFRDERNDWNAIVTFENYSS